MGDWDTKPEPYPEHDTDWRRGRNECKRDVVGVFGGYDAAVQAAVLSERLSTRVEHQAEEQFTRDSLKMTDTEPAVGDSATPKRYRATLKPEYQCQHDRTERIESAGMRA